MNSTQQWQSVTWFEVDEHQAGQRIDNFLFSRLKGVPKSRIYRLIREGQVRVNKKRIDAVCGNLGAPPKPPQTGSPCDSSADTAASISLSAGPAYVLLL